MRQPLVGQPLPRDVLRSIRVDREPEIQACVRQLSRRAENVFIWGARGVGKTFLVYLIEDELSSVPEVLPVRLDLLGLPGFGRHEPANAFPETVLLGICRAVWKDVLKRPYSELRERLDLRLGDLRLPSGLARTVENIYVRVMAAQRKARYEYGNSVGFSAGAKGEKRETGWIEQEQPPILPFEFFEFIEELLASLREAGKSRVVALCDEANRLPFDQQRDILGRYLDLFTSRSVQFLFVAGVHPWELEPPPIPDGFDLVLQLKGLASDATSELLTKAALSLGSAIEPSAAALAHSLLAGNPRLLLMALEDAVTLAGNLPLDAASIEQACRRVLTLLDRHRVEIERSRNPRARRGRSAKPKPA